MAGNVQTLAAGVSEVAAATAITKISPNTRVSATTGTLGTVADVLQFPGLPAPFTVVGNWVVPNTRCMVNGLPTISVSSVGVGVNVVGIPTGPLLITLPDTRVSAQ